MIHPLAITMWDFSWIERRWDGAGFEDWNAALDGVKERGYDAVRIDAFPHLLSQAPEKEWLLLPVWYSNDWGSPYKVRVRLFPALINFLKACRARRIKVALSSWFLLCLLDLAYIAKDSCAEIEKQGASILRKLPAA